MSTGSAWRREASAKRNRPPAKHQAEQTASQVLAKRQTGATVGHRLAGPGHRRAVA